MSLFLPSLVVLLCALCVGGLFFAGRFLRGRALKVAHVPCRLLGSLDLSTQHVLYVVEAGEKRLLLGGAPGGLSLIAELPRAQTVTAAPREAIAAPAEAEEMAA